MPSSATWKTRQRSRCRSRHWILLRCRLTNRGRFFDGYANRGRHLKFAFRFTYISHGQKYRPETRLRYGRLSLRVGPEARTLVEVTAENPETPRKKPEKRARSHDDELVEVFTRCWRESGQDTNDLPESWLEQLAVWNEEGISAALLKSYFDAWKRKPRTNEPEALYRYLQVCCFNRRHGRVRRTNDKGRDWYVDTSPWSEPSWMGRDPGSDGGW